MRKHLNTLCSDDSLEEKKEVKIFIQMISKYFHSQLMFDLNFSASLALIFFDIGIKLWEIFMIWRRQKKRDFLWSHWMPLNHDKEEDATNGLYIQYVLIFSQSDGYLICDDYHMWWSQERWTLRGCFGSFEEIGEQFC